MSDGSCGGGGGGVRGGDEHPGDSVSLPALSLPQVGEGYMIECRSWLWGHFH